MDLPPVTQLYNTTILGGGRRSHQPSGQNGLGGGRRAKGGREHPTPINEGEAWEEIGTCQV